MEPEATAPTPAEPEVPAWPVDRGGPYKVLILGDSMAATDFGAALQKRLDAHQKVKVFRRGKSATGLARPDFFNWFAESQKQIKAKDPDLVILVLGGNDGQDLRPMERGERPARWGTDDWAREYRERTHALLRPLLAPHRRVVVLELPQMDHKSFEKKLSTIRAVQKAAVEELAPEATYVETAPFFFGPGGELLKVIPAARGKKSTMRQDDGIHFTVPGAAYFAERVEPVILELLGLAEPRS